jgi:hypothetical protein
MRDRATELVGLLVCLCGDRRPHVVPGMPHVVPGLRRRSGSAAAVRAGVPAIDPGLRRWAHGFWRYAGASGGGWRNVPVGGGAMAELGRPFKS